MMVEGGKSERIQKILDTFGIDNAAQRPRLLREDRGRAGTDLDRPGEGPEPRAAVALRVVLIRYPAGRPGQDHVDNRNCEGLSPLCDCTTARNNCSCISTAIGSRQRPTEGAVSAWLSTSMSGRSRVITAGAWENLVEKAERERRAALSDRAAKPIDETTSQERIRPSVIAWRAAIAKALGERSHRRHSIGTRRRRRLSSPIGRAGTDSARSSCGRPMPSIRTLRLPDDPARGVGSRRRR